MKKDPTWKIGKNTIIDAKSMRKNNASEGSIGKNAVFLSNSTVYLGSTIGKSLIIGHNSIIREECTIGDNFKLWNNSVVDYGCRIGNNVKVHCNCYIAQFTTIEDNVFIAPGTVTTNDKYPGSQLSQNLKGPTIKKGAQIGGNVTILPGIIIGERAIIGSGSVVTKNIPTESVALGNPARVVCNIRDLKDEKGNRAYK